MIYVGNVVHVGRYMVCVPNRKTDELQTQAENQTCFRRSSCTTDLSPSHSNEYRASMHWGVAFITARADGVYAMMMDSFPDVPR